MMSPYLEVLLAGGLCTWQEHTGLAFPVTPPNYFRLQGRERQWFPVLEQWFRQHGLLAEDIQVHGLVLMGTTGGFQYIGALMCERPMPSEHASPYHVMYAIATDTTQEVLDHFQELQEFLATYNGFLE